MQTSLYVGLSAQLALQKRMETVAHNVANANTAGFRAEEVRFEELLSRHGDGGVAFAGAGGTFISREAGGMQRTGGAFDVAVKGEGWLAIATPQGQAYTRDGRLQMTPEGELRTLNGHAVLDVGGAPIQLDPAGGPPQIAADGAITQNGRRTGVIGLFGLNADAKLTRYENSGVLSDPPGWPILDFSRNGVMQGYLEGANVNAVSEMSSLIAVSRAFDAVANTLGATENTLNDGLRTLSGAS
ncbi:MAG: flagellar basal-body rod protein FlgF [Hyphomicrobiales bacterium]|nr:flagellar basal-body rod protein FlgF [Hyphomicrobiales bacterium]